MATRAFDLSILLADTPAAQTSRSTVRQMVVRIILCGSVYGAVMGSFGGFAGDHLLQAVYSAIKAPILILLSFAICLPFFFTLNTLLGLRDDFGQALAALLKTQAIVTLALVSLSPYTAIWYCSTTKYEPALLFNAAIFTIASAAGQAMLRKFYQPLIHRNRCHQMMLRLWLFLYAFVGIQMGWTLRPFVGDPRTAVHFFRDGAFTNAYEMIWKILWHVVTQTSR